MSMPDSNPRFLVISQLQRAEVFACAGEWASADECYVTAIAADDSPQSRLTFANSLRAALSRETADATVIIVAQRVATIRQADRIIVLDEGTVVGTGTHSELMDGNETYREIVLSQLTEQEAA